MKLDCEVIRDLMPLCAEEIASDKSRALVEDHLTECEACREAYAAMKSPEPPVTERKTEAEHFQQSYKKQKTSLIVKIGLIVGIAGILFGGLMVSIGLVSLSMLTISETAKVEEYTDVAAYNDYFGDSAKRDYQYKWMTDMDIFPAAITEEMNVQDFKMVYYNPWDAQYLSYLTVQYPAEAYEAECAKLAAYPSTDYVGYYSVTEFPEGELLAMNADDYSGFVYAIRTPGKERCITYVELMFCNYFFDLDYSEYIPAEYLPPGFNAAMDNPYQIRKNQEQGLR